MAQFSPESAANQPESLSAIEIQEHVASLGPIFDLIVEQGNSRPGGAYLNTGKLGISPIYDTDTDVMRSLQGIVYTEDRSVEGKMIFTGSRDNESENFSWQLTRYPAKNAEPTEEALHLAEQYVVPLASIWRTLPPEAQGLYLKQFVKPREETAPRPGIAQSMARLITRLSRS